MMSLLKFLKKPWVIILVVVLLVAIFGIYKAISGSKSGTLDTAKATRESLTQEVAVTGKVQPAEDVALSFEKSGKVSRVNVKIGDRVTDGQVLAELNPGELSAQLLQAQGALDSARASLNSYIAARDVQQAKLDSLKAGTRPEQLQVKESELAKAQQDLNNYYDTVLNTVRTANTKADDAVRQQTSLMFTGTGTSSYNLTFTSCDPLAESEAEGLRGLSEQELITWNAEINSISSTAGIAQKDSLLAKSASHLAQVKKFLERANDTLTSGCTLSSTNLDTYRTNLNTGRVNVNTSISNVETLQQNIAAQKLTVQRIGDELALAKAGSTAEDIAAQEASLRQAEAGIAGQQAQIKQAEANVQNYQAQIAKGIIHSPISGVITKRDLEPGETATAGVAVLAVISESQMQIKADVPEVDIAKVAVGNTASTTLDAYGSDENFPTKVVSIDPAETVLSGVIYYKVTITFGAADAWVKPGMTANVTILTAKKDGVIAVPQRAVVEEGTKKYVRVLTNPDDNSKIDKREVMTGLTGSGGLVEIVSGLAEGDTVVTFQK